MLPPKREAALQRGWRPGQRPGRTVWLGHELLRIRITHDALVRHVPLNPASGPERDVAEMAGDHRVVPDLDVGVRPPPGVDAGEKVAHVFQVHVAAGCAARLPAATIRLLAGLRL